MYEKAIQVANQFTRPIYVVTRSFGSKAPQPGAGSLMLLNNEGWALTCKHVAAVLIQQKQITENYTKHKAQLAAVPKGMNPKRWEREVKKQGKMLPTTPVQIISSFVNCVDRFTGFDLRVHPTLDIALVKFHGYTKVNCSQFPVFGASRLDLVPGKSLCRVGFPFAEYSNFSYDATTDTLQWTNNGNTNTPLFPLEGMVTRMIANPMQDVVGFELSTPGLKGQSGGPAFDVNGTVWGMQSMTRHLDLDFDIDKEVLRAGLPKQVKDTAFLHVGQCVHVDELKKFMRSNGVSFEEQRMAGEDKNTAVA